MLELFIGVQHRGFHSIDDENNEREKNALRLICALGGLSHGATSAERTKIEEDNEKKIQLK